MNTDILDELGAHHQAHRLLSSCCSLVRSYTLPPSLGASCDGSFDLEATA